MKPRLKPTQCCTNRPPSFPPHTLHQTQESSQAREKALKEELAAAEAKLAAAEATIQEGAEGAAELQALREQLAAANSQLETLNTELVRVTVAGLLTLVSIDGCMCAAHSSCG
jgi:hypothetical protein